MTVEELEALRGFIGSWAASCNHDLDVIEGDGQVPRDLLEPARARIVFVEGIVAKLDALIERQAVTA